MIYIIIICIICAFILISSYAAYRTAFYSPLPRREDPYKIPRGRQHQACKTQTLALVREFDSLPYEPVYIRSFDGLCLFGRYYHVRSGAPLEIQFHGYHGTAQRDMCALNKIAREMGMNTLVIDQRAHGKSGGHSICMGIKERMDCVSWANYAAERFGGNTPVIIAGVSMGAAAVLMAAELELPFNVKGIIADCPFSSPKAIIKKVAHDKPVTAPFYPFALLGAIIYGGANMSAAAPVAAVKHAKVPILLIHGEDDRFVPCAMSREIADACAGYVRRETFPGAGHNLSSMTDYKRYKQTVEEFTGSCLSEK